MTNSCFDRTFGTVSATSFLVRKFVQLKGNALIFADRLINSIIDKQTPLVVGLDPRLERLPTAIAEEANKAGSTLEANAKAYERFCFEIIDTVAPLVPAVKPQAAFFEVLGVPGMQALWNVVRYAQSKQLQVIMDAKRGDIGSTAEAYAQAFLGNETNSSWGCDCLTVNPFLGDDSLEPFVKRCQDTSSGIFVLVRTSNPGGRMIQELEANNRKIYSIIAEHVQRLAAADTGEHGYGSIGAVIGATNPAQLVELRSQMPNSIFLVPGIGAQGATAKDIAGAFDERGLGAVINSSRAIIFAHEKPEFAKFESNWQRAVEAATRQTIDAIASETSAGNLQREAV